jgi:hypothetical protein
MEEVDLRKKGETRTFFTKCTTRVVAVLPRGVTFLAVGLDNLFQTLPSRLLYRESAVGGVDNRLPAEMPTRSSADTSSGAM